MLDSGVQSSVTLRMVKAGTTKIPEPGKDPE
jgi:hypothetical protein